MREEWEEFLGKADEICKEGPDDPERWVNDVLVSTTMTPYLLHSVSQHFSYAHMAMMVFVQYVLTQTPGSLSK